MSRAQGRLTIGFAAAGVLLVAGAIACVAYAFGPRVGLEFWLLAIPLALTPYAVVTVALGTVRGGFWVRGLVTMVALAVILAGIKLFWEVLGEARDRSMVVEVPQLWRLWSSVTDSLLVQGATAVIAAFASGLTWERRPRYGLWFLFTAGFLAFALLLDFDEQPDRSIASEFPRAARDLKAGRIEWGLSGRVDWGLSVRIDHLFFGLGSLLVPAMCLGWLAQCAAPRRPRRDADLRADYADQPPPAPAH